ncbi:hypothetical protein ACN47E_001386 [Coniothyrium glycines]
MKFTLAISTLTGLSSAVSTPRQETTSCLGASGVRAFIRNPNQGGPAVVATFAGEGNVAACQARCFSPAYASCRSFAVRTNAASGGACQLFATDVTPSLTPNPASTIDYYVLPAGIQGWVPENVGKHYLADTSKTKGTYDACRGFCLQQPNGKCRGFGFKAGGNCQLYDVSLVGKVKADATSPYVQYLADCNTAPRVIISPE